MAEAKTKDLIVEKFSQALDYALKAYRYKVKVKGQDDDALQSSIYNILVMSGVLKQSGNAVPSEIADIVKNNPRQVQKALAKSKQ